MRLHLLGSRLIRRAERVFPLVTVAVAVGFEPTVELPPHTLSRSVTACSHQVGNVPGLRRRRLGLLGEHRRTGVNETRTETRPGPGGQLLAAAMTPATTSLSLA